MRPILLVLVIASCAASEAAGPLTSAPHQSPAIALTFTLTTTPSGAACALSWTVTSPAPAQTFDYRVGIYDHRVTVSDWSMALEGTFQQSVTRTWVRAGAADSTIATDWQVWQFAPAGGYTYRDARHVVLRCGEAFSDTSAGLPTH